ncbi:hypothetical protein [Actinokineospora inagensis]|uniref:hypothetical protein n=1 Tax=Actinokineospora inagensis TaxID=103730 RepID=UPI000401D68E|nr:hypothetical protein [Actinokineospora inagensis]
MAAIEVDPAWIGGYATTVATAAEELGNGADVLRTAPLTPEAFGSLGRTTRVTESYTRASELLRGQLARGVEALHAASAALTQIADKHRVSDDDGAQSITRSGQG